MSAQRTDRRTKLFELHGSFRGLRTKVRRRSVIRATALANVLAVGSSISRDVPVRDPRLDDQVLQVCTTTPLRIKLARLDVP